MQKYRVPLVLSAAFVLFGCSASPESTIELFHNAISKGDISGAKSYMSNQVIQMIGDGAVSSALAEGTEEIKKCGGLESVKSDLTGEGEARSGSVTLYYKGSECKPAIHKVRLIKEDGRWKIEPRGSV